MECDGIRLCDLSANNALVDDHSGRVAEACLAMGVPPNRLNRYVNLQEEGRARAVANVLSKTQRPLAELLEHLGLDALRSPVEVGLCSEEGEASEVCRYAIVRSTSDGSSSGSTYDIVQSSTVPASTVVYYLFERT